MTKNARYSSNGSVAKSHKVESGCIDTVRTRVERHQNRLNTILQFLCLPGTFLAVSLFSPRTHPPCRVLLLDQVEYYRQGSEAHFRGILNEIIEALTPETERFYADDRRAFDVGRIRILNALAADSVKQASNCTDRSSRDDRYTAALSHLTSADRIDNMSELTWVGKGVFYLCQGELDRAKYFFENARKQRHNFPATLGEAAVNFHHGNYKQALDLYRLELTSTGAPRAQVFTFAQVEH